MNHYKAIIAGIKYLRARGVDVYLSANKLKLCLAYKTLEMFQRQLWSYALDFFRGDISDAEFEDSFFSAIEGQLTKAWNEGADEVGVLPEDMTEEDNAILLDIIATEEGYVTNLGVDILDAIDSKIDLESFRSQFGARIDIWANRYNDVANQAKLHFGGKEKLRWVYGDTQHCSTCSALNGIVAYADEWETSGFHPQQPQNDLLECSGWHCACELMTTNERRTRDALQILLDLAVGQNV